MLELFGSLANVITGWMFLTILLLVFALFLILAGVFTAYFGSGKSRTIGVVLLVVGFVVGILVGYLFHTGTLNGGASSANANQLLPLIWVAFEVIVAAVIGALIAIGIFLVAIMKS
jgi:hypothetical protein